VYYRYCVCLRFTTIAVLPTLNTTSTRDALNNLFDAL
jgi:hypothetical protein